MSEKESQRQDCIDPRTRRALEECMTVLPDHGRAEDALGLFAVIGENGNGEYLVDARTESCECNDAKYRDPEGGCKHLRRCRIATGETPVPASALSESEIAIDDTFGVHVDGSAKFATADGGFIDGETGKDIVEENTAASVWSDPKPEVDKYGQPTGDHYVTCQECGLEVLITLTDCVSHRDDCRYE